MFPENGSGVDAAGDCGACELDERATKPSTALFMTVWHCRSRNAESSCGIRQG